MLVLILMSLVQTSLKISNSFVLFMLVLGSLVDALLGFVLMLMLMPVEAKNSLRPPISPKDHFKKGTPSRENLLENAPEC